MKKIITLYNNTYKNFKNLNTTTWEFDNVIIQMPNFIDKDIHNVVSASVTGDLDLMAKCYVLYVDKMQYSICAYPADKTVIRSDIISNNLELKNERTIMHLKDLGLSFPNSIINDPDIKPIVVFDKFNLEDNMGFIYKILLSVNYNKKDNIITTDFYTEDKNIIIDFEDSNYILNHIEGADPDFIDVYTRILLEKI